MGIAVFDATALSVALLLTRDFSTDFFLLYFVVIFIAALTERLSFLVVIAVAISLLHLYVTMGTLSVRRSWRAERSCASRFLFVVALFFGISSSGFARPSVTRRKLESTRRSSPISSRRSSTSFKTPLGAIQAMAEIVLEPQTSR